MPTSDTACSRVQIVLVPGFAGFDALGQLQYYADVTPLFRDWASGKSDTWPLLLYFDNLPTAGVATRAGRLRDWLAKRIARGELRQGDRLALIGHSTGGLDIRQLVWDLAQHPAEEISVDGGHGAACTVLARELLDHLRRIVFLSVPQWGTNIADWLRAHGPARRAFVAQLLAAVAARDLPLVDRFETWAARSALKQGRPELLLAIRDAVTEMNVRRADDPKRAASAQEARAEIELWLRYIWSDFSAIDDLATAPLGDNSTPARFDADRRSRERETWADHEITTRSYATMGSRAFRFEHGTTVPQWKVLNPFTWPGPDESAGAIASTDLPYRIAYRACAGGPFTIPGGGATATATRFDDHERQEVEVWDNDGIVNTASMLWPEGSETRLVAADHGDIIGHFHLVKAVQPAGREYHTYDLLRSGSGFDQGVFRSVWRDVFEFCVA